MDPLARLARNGKEPAQLVSGQPAILATLPGTSRSERIVTRGYPVRLLEMVDPDEPLVTTTGFGNRAWLVTGAPVFLDARMERYPAQLLRRYIALRDGEPRAVATVAGCGPAAGGRAYRQALLSRWYDDALLEAAKRGFVGAGDDRVDIELLGARGDWYLLRLSCPRGDSAARGGRVGPGMPRA